MKKPFNSSRKQPNFRNVTLNPKLLHTKPFINQISYPHCSPDFFNCRMHFFLRKVLKENNIHYTYYRTPNRFLIVEGPESPFKLVFTFDDLGYVGIKRMSNQHITIEFQLLAPTVQKLWDKMFHKGIICNREYKALIVSQALNAQQTRSR
jgi:hypothetical protein